MEFILNKMGLLELTVTSQLRGLPTDSLDTISYPINLEGSYLLVTQHKQINHAVQVIVL